MRKSIAIILLSLYSISVFQMQELLAIPKFIEHFTKHQHQDSSLDLWTFIKMHYFSGDVKDADYKEDMKLPFKSIDNSTVLTISFIPPVFNWLELNWKVRKNERELFSKSLFQEQSCLNLLFRPPISIS